MISPYVPAISLLFRALLAPAAATRGAMLASFLDLVPPDAVHTLEGALDIRLFQRGPACAGLRTAQRLTFQAASLVRHAFGGEKDLFTTAC